MVMYWLSFYVVFGIALFINELAIALPLPQPPPSLIPHKADIDNADGTDKSLKKRSVQRFEERSESVNEPRVPASQENSYTRSMQIFITKSMRKTLQEVLFYSTDEIDDMEPRIASVVIEKKLHRPRSGMPIAWRKSFQRHRKDNNSIVRGLLSMPLLVLRFIRRCAVPLGVTAALGMMVFTASRFFNPFEYFKDGKEFENEDTIFETTRKGILKFEAESLPESFPQPEALSEHENKSLHSTSMRREGDMSTIKSMSSNRQTKKKEKETWLDRIVSDIFGIDEDK